MDDTRRERLGAPTGFGAMVTGAAATDQVAGRVLPLKGDLKLVRISSIVISLAVGGVSVIGLWWGSEGRYAGSPLVQVSEGGDAANLILGLPMLLGSVWLARRRSLLGLLLWPGALLYLLYAPGVLRALGDRTTSLRAHRPQPPPCRGREVVEGRQGGAGRALGARRRAAHRAASQRCRREPAARG